MPCVGSLRGWRRISIAERNGKTNCYYGKLEKVYKVSNYLDAEMKPRTWEEMKPIIEEKVGRCDSWSPMNTCEHLVTEIRYGTAVCKQKGTQAKKIYKVIDRAQDLFGPHSRRRRRSLNLRTAAAAAAA